MIPTFSLSIFHGYLFFLHIYASLCSIIGILLSFKSHATKSHVWYLINIRWMIVFKAMVQSSANSSPGTRVCSRYLGLFWPFQGPLRPSVIWSSPGEACHRTTPRELAPDTAGLWTQLWLHCVYTSLC